MARTGGAARWGPQTGGDTHEALAARLDALCSQLRAAPRPDQLPAWTAFVEALLVHLAFEEDVLFPAFAHRNIASSRIVQSLVAEHAAVRLLAAEIGQQIERDDIRSSTLEVFIDLLREHAEAEDAHIHGWCSSGATR